MLQGHEADARASIDRALRHADALGHEFSRGVALYFAALVDDLRGDFAGVLEHGNRLTALVEEHRFPFWRGAALGFRGRALSEQGTPAEGLELLRAALALTRAGSPGAPVANFLRSIAEAHRAMGAADQALAAIAEALATCERDGDRASEPELHRMRAEILSADPRSWSEAEASFERAIAVAREQGAVLYARRAAASFARYLRDQGRVTEADQLVAAAALPS